MLSFSYEVFSDSIIFELTLVLEQDTKIYLRRGERGLRYFEKNVFHFLCHR